MAESTFTQTGLAEMRQAIEQFPAAHTAALRAVAQATAGRVMARAKALLASQTHGTGATAAAITVTEDAANKQFIVSSPGVPHPTISLHTMKRSGRTHTQKVSQNNLPIWLEYGTVHMTARPYMRPAAAAEEAQYARDMENASADAAAKAFA